MQDKAAAGTASKRHRGKPGPAAGGLAMAGGGSGRRAEILQARLNNNRMLRKAASVAKNSAGKNQVSASQIVFQKFGDADFPCPPCGYSRARFLPAAEQIGDEDAEGYSRGHRAFSSQRGALGARLFADHDEAAGAVPTQQLQENSPTA